MNIMVSYEHKGKLPFYPGPVRDCISLAALLQQSTPGQVAYPAEIDFLSALEARSISQYWQGWFLLRIPFLAQRQLSSHCVLTRPSLCLCRLYLNFLF